MSTIKGTPKHNEREGGSGEISKNYKSLVRKRGERKNETREPKRRTSSHILEILQNII